MAVATKSCVPAIITAGDTVIISVGPDALYPNTGWMLQFVLSRNGKILKAWNATSDLSSLGFIVTLPRTDTANIAPGRATWSYLFTETSTSQRQTSDTGDLLVAPDPTKSLPDSDAAKALKGCMEAIGIIAADPNQTVNFNGQSYSSQNISELLKARDRLQIIVDNELRSLGVSKRGGAKMILARFR
jgi:hypothetical protein